MVGSLLFWCLTDHFLFRMDPSKVQCRKDWTVPLAASAEMHTSTSGFQIASFLNFWVVHGLRDRVSHRPDVVDVGTAQSSWSLKTTTKKKTAGGPFTLLSDPQHRRSTRVLATWQLSMRHWESCTYRELAGDNRFAAHSVRHTKVLRTNSAPERKTLVRAVTGEQTIGGISYTKKKAKNRHPTKRNSVHSFRSQTPLTNRRSG